ncbi:hypothetical protein L1049_027487 [Liquidambar formosana]|uniref:Uncharacterized protein n=1 Tax=Liquidambar formosana TaxID=63359 RepID=A0AAP0WVH0_LIQFO
MKFQLAIEESNSITQPLIINLSEEALDAYNEAYEELMKINEAEEEDLPSGVGQNGEENSFMPHCTIRKDKTSRKCGPPNVRTWEEHISRVQRLNASNVSGDEYSDCDDEMEKLLIQQIVEKTKKGSPVVLNAQRVLMSNYENVH